MRRIWPTVRELIRGRVLVSLVLLGTSGPALLSIPSCQGHDYAYTEQIPLDLLFGSPSRSRPKVAPDASMLAYSAPVRQVQNIWIGAVGSRDFRPITRDTLRGISKFYWAPDSRHILYFQDQDGNEHWHLYTVNIYTGEQRDLTPFPEVSAGLVGLRPDIPDHVLITLNRRDPSLQDVYRLDFPSGELTMVVENPGQVADWIVAPDFTVRGAVKASDRGGFELIVRDKKGEGWRSLVHWGADEVISSGNVSFDVDGRSAYMLDSRESNTARLVRVNLASGKTDVLLDDPQHDVYVGLTDPFTGRPQVGVIIKDRDSLVVLDSTVAEDIGAIERLHRGDPFLTSYDKDNKLWVVGFSTDNEPSPYYLYDRTARTAAFLFYDRPNLIDYALAEMEPVSFEARDGLVIHGYLTFPPGRSRRGLPMVLNVHGGPWARDYWGFDPEAQWLANRGYLCMQVNYRGSVGYGKDFQSAGDREWGGRMEDDLEDAVKWAVHQGYADPGRVGIYGYSYGGYAALIGITKTPELYRCAISMGGPTDLVSLVESFPPHWSTASEIWYEKVGHPKTDRAFLRARSPITHVDSVRVPVMIVQGANDARVPQEDADRFVRELEKRNVTVEYMLLPDEGHQISRPGNRLKVYARMERFLDRYLND